MSRHNLSLKIQPQLWEPGTKPESEWQVHHSVIFSNSATHKGIESPRKKQAEELDAEGKKEAILTTGSEVKRQVLLPAAEIQPRRRKEAGRFKWGGGVGGG